MNFQPFSAAAAGKLCDGYCGRGGTESERRLPPAADSETDASDQIPPGGQEYLVLPGR